MFQSMGLNVGEWNHEQEVSNVKIKNKSYISYLKEEPKKLK